MYQWNWVCLAGSSVGNAITVASRGIRQQSVEVAVRHHAPTDASLSHRQLQDQISHKKGK